MPYVLIMYSGVLYISLGEVSMWGFYVGYAMITMPTDAWNFSKDIQMLWEYELLGHLLIILLKFM